MNDEEKAELLANLILWIANCPIKLKPETINGIVSQIHLQVLHEKLKKGLESL